MAFPFLFSSHNNFTRDTESCRKHDRKNCLILQLPHVSITKIDVKFNHHQQLQCMNPHRKNKHVEDPRVYWSKKLSKHWKDHRKQNNAANTASKNADQRLFYTVLESQHLNLSPWFCTIHRLSQKLVSSRAVNLNLQFLSWAECLPAGSEQCQDSNRSYWHPQTRHGDEQGPAKS